MDYDMVYIGRRLNHQIKIQHHYLIVDSNNKGITTVLSNAKLGHTNYLVGTILSASIDGDVFSDNSDKLSVGVNKKPKGAWPHEEQVSEWILLDKAAHTAWAEVQAINKALNGRTLEYQIDLIRKAYRRCPPELRASLLGYIIRKITS